MLRINKWVVKERLDELNLTQSGAAIKLNCNESSLSALLNSERVKCSAELAAKICALLGLAFDQVFSLDPAQH